MPIWNDGRAAKREADAVKLHHKMNWHPYFAWWPTKLSIPYGESRTVWLHWIERKYDKAITSYVWWYRERGSEHDT